jgi:hypothetical protein
MSQKSENETEEIFTKIYKINGWAGTDSVSGTGSDLQQTRIIIKKLPGLFTIPSPKMEKGDRPR